MVIALFGLALVMILGGVASVVQGFPYVRLESGLAMVIGGTSAASAGAILLGLAAAVGRLKRIEQAIRTAGLRETASVPLPREIAPAPAPVIAAPAFAGAAGPALGAPGMSAPGEPTDAAASAIHVDPVDRIVRPAPDPEPTLPDLLPPEERKTVAPVVAVPPPLEEPERVEPHVDLFEEPEAPAVRADQSEPMTLRSSLDDDVPEPAAAAEPGAPAPAVEDKPAADALQVVGTYASGGNTYVMYANGSIQADTPKGRFNFDSLDELKAFVEGGGENNPARGAA